jgi:hypothetical protein
MKVRSQVSKRGLLVVDQRVGVFDESLAFKKSTRTRNGAGKWRRPG